MQFVEVVVTDILAAPGVERHPEPGLHGDRGLHVGAEGDAVPADGGGAGRLGRAVAAHAQDLQGQASAQGKKCRPRPVFGTIFHVGLEPGKWEP